MSRLRFSVPAAAAILLAATACGQLTSKNSLTDPGQGPTKSLGCVQGVAVNGLTGAAVSIADLESTKSTGIRVLIGDTVLVPNGRDQKTEAALDLTGHYTLCNVPMDEDYPIVVDVSGYQQLQGVVHVDSTSPAKSDKGKTDLVKLVPTEIVNLRLYPAGVQTADLKFVVTFDGKAQKDAQVVLTPTGKNTLDQDQFLVPAPVDPKPLTQTTNDHGEAVFAASTLVLGSEMQYRVIPPTGSAATDQALAEGHFHVGLLTEGTAQSPYLVFVDLKNPQPALALVSSSLESKDYSDDGSLVLVYNRELELVPGTEDNVVAALIDANGAELVKDIPGNGKPDQVLLDLSVPRTLKLSPVWKTKPSKDHGAEGGVKIAYNGLSLRPKSSPGTAAEAVQPGVLTVPIFGGVTPPQVATTVALAANIDGGSGADQTGPAAQELIQPVVVVVLDQFGNPFKQAFDLTFTTLNPGGGLHPADRTSLQSSIAVATDPATGLAKAYWHLGTITGPQSLSVVGNAASLTTKILNVNATALGVPTDLRISNGTLTAKAGAELADPVSVQVLDQNNVAMASAVPVHFAPQGPGGGAVRGDGASGPAIDVKAPAGALAQAFWTLGSTPGAQTLLVSVGNVKKVVTATALQSYTGLTVDTTTFPPAPLGSDLKFRVTLNDLQGNPYKGADTLVNLQLVTGTGTLAPASPSAGSCASTSCSVLVDATGMLYMTFHVAGGAPSSAFQIHVSSGTFAADVSGQVAATFTSLAQSLPSTPSAQPTAAGADATYTIQLRDQAGGDLKTAGIGIWFTPTFPSTSVLNVRAVGDQPANGQPKIRLVTDATGKASVTLRVVSGKSADPFQVSAQPDAPYSTMPAVTFAGTVQ